MIQTPNPLGFIVWNLLVTISRASETQRVAWPASRLRKAAMRPCDCCKGRREREREQRRRETGTSAIFGFELEPLLIMMKSNLVQDAIFF